MPMPAFAPVDSPELLPSDAAADVDAEPEDDADAEPELPDAAAVADAEELPEDENSDTSFCWNAIVIGCPHMVTFPKLAPSSVEVTIRFFGTKVLSGLASTVVVSSELNVDMHPTRAPAALSPLVAEE
jgi:hypothetical protein